LRQDTLGTYFTIIIFNKKTDRSHLELLQSVFWELQFNERSCYGADITVCMAGWGGGGCTSNDINDSDPESGQLNVEQNYQNVSYYPELC